MKKLSIVKYNYKSLDKKWRKNNPKPFKGMAFIYFGEIPNMEGHVYCQDVKTGKPYILHSENIILK